MKTLLSVFLQLCVLSGVFVKTADAQRRGVVWVHGLNSNSSEWSNWDNIFSAERQINTLNRSSYNTDVGVQNMANQVAGNYGADNRNIYFGHSMGGVVGRDIDVRFNNTFGGIVTAGSPFDGARISNAARSGEASNMIIDGIDRILQGPSRQLGPVAFFIETFVVDGIVRLLDNTINLFGLRNFGSQGGDDLQESSGYMNNGIRNQQTSTAKIHIYGNEDGPTPWRLASQAIGNGDDDQYVSLVRTAGDVYEAAMWINYGIAVVSGIFTFGIAAAYPAWVGEGWSQGMNWWRYDSERNWNHLIGSDIPSTKTLCSMDLDFQGFNNCMSQYAGTQATYQQYITCQNQNTHQNCYTYYASVNGQSDAFIKSPSQTGYNSNWSSGASTIEARGVNHLEMKKHPRMRDIYNEIFNGNHGGFFQTP